MKTVRCISDVQELLYEATKGKRFIWFGKRAYDAFGLNVILGRKIEVISWDYDSNNELINLYSAEYREGVRRKGSTSDLINAAIESDLPGSAIVFPYQSNYALETLAQKLGWHLLSNPMSVKDCIKDKMAFPELLKSAGVSYLKFLNVPLDRAVFGILSSQLGLPFVFQLPRSSSGNGTFLISNELQLMEAVEYGKQRNTVVGRATEYVHGTISPNVNCINTTHGVIVAPPSLQLLGIEEACAGFGKYCGNDYSSWKTVSVPIQREIIRKSAKLGHQLVKLRYRGVFGIDFISATPIEVNDRVNGGTGTLTQACLRQGVIPPIAFHLLEMLGVDYGLDVCEYNNQLNSVGLEGFHLILTNQSNEDLIVPAKIIQGVYKTEKGALIHKSNGDNLCSLRDNSEFVIGGSLPISGTRVMSGAPICKVMGLHNALDTETGQLTKEVKLVVNTLLKHSTDHGG